MIQPTSIQSYLEIKQSGKDLSQKEIVYKILYKEGELNDREISSMSHLPINVVTARRNELYHEGRIVKSKEKYDWVTHKRTILWKVNPSQALS